VDLSQSDDLTEFSNLLIAQPTQQSDVQAKVDHIIAQVRLRKDEALLEFAREFDGVQANSAAALEIDSSVIASSIDQIEADLRAALEQAAARIRRFHEAQQQAVKQADFCLEDEFGSQFSQRTTAMQRVGIYVPGGKALYPSSVLMNGIPARVAGVKEIIMAVPLGQNQQVAPVVLAAAAIAGVDRVFTMGGAQAIAAMAYGTPSIPKVDTIVGPGNVYVALAKRAVFGQCGIDMIAGPSEILILADRSLPVDSCIFDLFSQAEHDELAQAVIISTDASYLDEIAKRLPRLLASQPRRAIIEQSLLNRGALVLVKSWQQAIVLSNMMAPEHLELAFEGAEAFADQVEHAGSVFVGVHTTESFGDYCAGPNHVLPTSGSARFSSPLGVQDFQKRTAFTRCTAAGASELGKLAAKLARAEQLEAHALAAESRISQ